MATILVDGHEIPVNARATYYPRKNLRTPPLLYLEWHGCDLILTGEKANNTRQLLVVNGGSVDLVLSTTIEETNDQPGNPS
jgi:hypothetical protein